MSDSHDHQTSAFMNVNVDAPGDVSSGGRLLSTSGDDKSPRIRMTKPAKLRVKLILVIFLIVTIGVAIILIATLTSSSSHSTFEDQDNSVESLVQSKHVRCDHDVIVPPEGSPPGHPHWRHYDSSAHVWKTIPNVENTGFVLISPKYRLEAGYPGIQVSLLLPRDNTRFYVMAVTKSFVHSQPVVMTPGSQKCESVTLDDPMFFDGNETTFRVYVFYKRKMRLNGLKFTVSSLPLAVRFRSLQIDAEQTTMPHFVQVQVGDRDICSVEIENSEVQCNWWNIEDGDNADFKSIDSHECISSGVRSGKSATWFFSLTSHDVDHESRALLISPVIKRQTSSLLFTMWYIFKCEGPRIRIHLVPVTNSLRSALAPSSVVAEVTSPASHNDWKFVSFQIQLPEQHDAYHLVVEGIVMSKGNCSDYACTSDGFNILRPKLPTSPMLGLDGIGLELMHEQCEPTNKSNVMDCKFQTENGVGTLCEWESSVPGNFKGITIPGVDVSFWQDWKAANSGDDDDHGATAQHFIGRGHIMSFDASGRAKSQSYVRTPLLKANNNCSCVMSFLYLMRGILTPRMQVNMIYGANIDDESRPLEPQWSLLGNQSDSWETAVIIINLKKNIPFQIELRVLDIYHGQADVHFDDMYFVGCDMDKA